MRAALLACATPLAFLAACSDASTPTAAMPPGPPPPPGDVTVPGDTATPDDTTAPGDTTTYAAAGATAIYPGESIQAAVSAHPPGTTFLIKAGVHRRQSVVPKSGNSFIGEPGAVLDGENATPHAFHKGGAPYPNNVRIQNLVIERYRPAVQNGALSAGNGTSGWVVENCEIRYNLNGGIRLGSRMRVLRNKIHHNGQIGMVGAGDSILVEGNEIAYNNYENRYTWGFELGGTKFVKTRWLVVRGNYVHHNQGNGLWTDMDNIYALYEGNRVEDNSGVGIFHEVSYDAVIRNNIVERNGSARGWLYGAGILIAHSPNVEVYGNTVTDNRQGIAGIQQNRGSGGYGPHLLANLHVHDNIVTMTSGQSGVGMDTGDDAVFTSRNNRFQNNTYHLGTNAKPFQWMSAARTVAQWQSYGHDRTASFGP